MAECIRIGTERNANNKREGKTNMNYSGRDDTAISVQGVIGELAFAKLLGGKADLNDTTCRNSFNDTFDCRLLCGWDVDVKTTVHEKADLRVTHWKKQRPPHCYALMIILNYGRTEDFTSTKRAVVSYRGTIKAGDVFDESNLRTIFQNRYYVVPQSHLRPIHELL
jgi:hypothetical protein